MKKLMLELDKLAVESFDTTATGKAKGTVFGEQCTCYTVCTCPGCPTCDNTCGNTCATCAASCPGCVTDWCGPTGRTCDCPPD